MMQSPAPVAAATEAPKYAMIARDFGMRATGILPVREHGQDGHGTLGGNVPRDG